MLAGTNLKADITMAAVWQICQVKRYMKFFFINSYKNELWGTLK